MANRFGRLALHMWTIDTTPLATALDAARAAGYDAVELRRIDLKRYFEASMSNAQVLDLVAKSGIPVGVLGVEYGCCSPPAKRASSSSPCFANPARTPPRSAAPC